MRGFGIFLIIVGVLVSFFGFLFGGWIPGLVLIALGLILTSLDGNRKPTPPIQPKRKTGFKGLAKKEKPKVKHLGIEKRGPADKALTGGASAIWVFILIGFVIALGIMGGKEETNRTTPYAESKFAAIKHAFSSTSVLGHDECVALGHYKIQMHKKTMNRFCKMEPTSSYPEGKTCTPVTRFMNEEQIKVFQAAINSQHHGEKGYWDLWVRDAMKYVNRCS